MPVRCGRSAPRLSPGVRVATERPGRGLGEWSRPRPAAGRPCDLGAITSRGGFFLPVFAGAGQPPGPQAWRSWLRRLLFLPLPLLLLLPPQHLLRLLFLEPKGPQPGSVERAVASGSFLSLLRPFMESACTRPLPSANTGSKNKSGLGPAVGQLVGRQTCQPARVIE